MTWEPLAKDRTLNLPAPRTRFSIPRSVSFVATAVNFGSCPSLPFVILIELVAEVVAVKFKIALPLLSEILFMIFGDVKVFTPVKVCPASVLAIVADVDGKVSVVPSVPANVSELFAVKVFPSSIVSVEPVAG